jgi:phage N-6-adenine-methyltransferase
MSIQIYIDELIVDPEIQIEERGIDKETVQAYIDAATNDAQFPPVVVFGENGNQWLSDGFHRVSAYRFLGLATIEADVREGNRQDAMVYAATANVTNGKPMSRREKQEAGKRLLEMTNWSQERIAKELAVDRGTVSKWKSTLEISRVDIIGQDGRQYDTSSIGHPRQVDEPEMVANLWDIQSNDDPELEDDEWRPPQAQRSNIAPLMTSDSCEWYTPPEIIERAGKVLGQIDLDPCSNSHETPNVPAGRHYTQDDDGLAQDWHGTVYMNPPYGQEIKSWVEKLIREYETKHMRMAIALVPARTDTAWFRQFRDFPICFIHGRLKFSGAQNSATFPSAVIGIGIDLETFVNAFGDIGDIYKRVDCTDFRTS